MDREIESRFGNLHQCIAAGEGWTWRCDASGRLAEIIVLDQFSRNLFREDARAYAQDAMALALAQEAVHQELDLQLEPARRRFLYMPYMHSESLRVHQEALRLFGQPGLEDNLEFEERHLRILERFGRYPHRNRVLGRESSEQELTFLKEPGSSF